MTVIVWAAAVAVASSLNMPTAARTTRHRVGLVRGLPACHGEEQRHIVGECPRRILKKDYLIPACHRAAGYQRTNEPLAGGVMPYDRLPGFRTVSVVVTVRRPLVPVGAVPVLNRVPRNEPGFPTAYLLPQELEGLRVGPATGGTTDCGVVIGASVGVTTTGAGVGTITTGAGVLTTGSGVAITGGGVGTGVWIG